MATLTYRTAGESHGNVEDHIWPGFEIAHHEFRIIHQVGPDVFGQIPYDDREVVRDPRVQSE